jgi:2-polyprenyl-6-methoxyphenol hydroxylase-like FAD-dependent oxidoreductase
MAEQGRERSTRVLVVGAGPVGLFSALCAARRGFAVEILDENPGTQARGHATLLHASSLRLLEQFDLAEPLLAAGHRLDRLALYVDDARTAAFGLPAPVLAVPQSELEALLASALRAEGIAVMHGRQATTITESNDRVQIRVMCWELARSQEHAREGIWQPVSLSSHEADFVIGADGRGSRVRSALGIDTAELGAPASYAMFELPSRTSDAEMVLTFSEGLVSAMVPLPGGRVRWGFQIESGTTERLYASDLSALLAQRAPWYEGEVERVDWGRVVRFGRRIARRFGKGRVWLAGDAAHGTSPLGAQSMNVGLTEAHDLVHHIAKCVDAGGTLGDLEQYGAESEREWQKLLGFNVSFDLLPNARSWLPPLARRLVPALPASSFELESLLGQMGLVLR